MTRIAVCDDESLCVEQLISEISELMKKITCSYKITCFSSGYDFILNLQEGNNYDIVFWDIMMDGCTGIDVGEKLRNFFKHKQTILIYVSSYDRRAKEVFLFKTHRFLSKPIDTELLKEALYSAYSMWKNEQLKSFSFKDRESNYITLPLRLIRYFEVGRSHRIEINSTKDNYEIYDSIKNLNNKLEQFNFLLVHQGFLINYLHIQKITYDCAIMTNEKEVPISGPKRKDVRKLYLEIRKRQGDNLWSKQ